MRYTILFTIAVMIVAASSGFAQIADNAGEYGFKFVSIPLHPASLAMAGRNTDALANPAAFAIQPAVNALDSQRSVGISHTRWLFDTDFTSLYYSYSNRRSNFGLLMRNLDYGQIEKRDDAGNVIGYYNPIDMSMTANYSRRINPSLYVGINGSVLYERISTASALALSGDLGLSWLPPFSDSRISFALRNLGLSSAMKDETIDLPIIAEIDLNKGFTYNNTGIELGASISKGIDEELKGSLNTELSYSELLFIRAGYRLNYSGNGISAGLGLRYQNFGIDYGWADGISVLNSVHSLGVSYHF